VNVSVTALTLHVALFPVALLTRQAHSPTMSKSAEGPDGPSSPHAGTIRTIASSARRHFKDSLSTRMVYLLEL
jgi:hypothetical protein